MMSIVNQVTITRWAITRHLRAALLVPQAIICSQNKIFLQICLRQIKVISKRKMKTHSNTCLAKRWVKKAFRWRNKKKIKKCNQKLRHLLLLVKNPFLKSFRIMKRNPKVLMNNLLTYKKSWITVYNVCNDTIRELRECRNI